jgi:hypothetical protein
MIPGEYVGAKVGRDCIFLFEVYQWCSLDYSCFEVWVIVCNAPLNLVISKLCFGNNIEGDWKCVNLFIEYKDFLRNVDLSCGSLSFGRQEGASAMILCLPGR